MSQPWATPPGTVQHSYGVDLSMGPRLYTEVSDELGKKTRRYTDAFGHVVQSTLGYGTTDATITQFVSNVLGQRTQATDPRGLVTTYTLNTRGLLTSRASPDAGTVNSQYDKAGNLRYTQDANQAAAGQVLFTTYDFANRPLVTGQAAATFASLNPDAPATFETDNANWLVVRQYDAMPPLTPPWSLLPTPPPLTNVMGRLAGVASKSNGAWQVTYFSYDADGQVTTRYTYTQANGGGSVLTALNTTATYTRDLRGALSQRSLLVGTNTFYHWYDYDNRGLLWKLFASTTSTKPPTPDVVDTYLPGGQPQNYQFLGGPLVPIRYTIRGQTEKIGDPALTTYPFSARYHYHQNGTVDTAEFYSAGSPAAQKRYRYVFRDASGLDGYDALNRLKSADFWTWTGTWTSTPAYDLAGITYDVSGNLRTLQRNRETGTPSWLVDNLTYNYAIPGTNRLSSVSEAAGATAEPWDAEAGSFTYDPNGNLLTAPAAPYSIATAITYNHQNLPVSLTSGGTTTTYRYDDAGQRITKQVGGGNTEVYVRDGATTLGVFTVTSAGTPTAWHFNLLWEDRVIGRQPNTGNRRYYHFDHLGSTRAVVEGATIVESYDFEPWGLLMPGRTLAGPTKEGFTSKEQDVETGLDYFGARYYMPALARWSSVDPLADSYSPWSPYSYVLDNPLALTDPDGRQAAGDLAKCKACHKPPPPPPPPPPCKCGLIKTANFLAGGSDAFTLGLTGVVRKAIDADDVIDRSSGAYIAGEATEFAAELAVAGVSAGLKKLAVKVSDDVARSAGRPLVTEFRAGRNGGVVHHRNPLAGHPSNGGSTIFPTRGLPASIHSGSWNLQYFSTVQDHLAAHRRLQRIEAAARIVWSPQAIAARPLFSAYRSIFEQEQ